MKRRARFYALPILLVACTCFTAVFVYDHFRVGKVLDSYQGVPVHDNGLLFFRSHGKHYSRDGYYYGQEWQCVEFVKRFYHDAKKHRMPQVMGHAKSFFDEAIPDGGLNPGRNLLQYRNGSAERPRTGDLLVFADTKYGHVGIVTESQEHTVEIIQQNVLWRTRQRFLLTASNGHYFITAPRTPAAWLRAPKQRVSLGVPASRR